MQLEAAHQLQLAEVDGGELDILQANAKASRKAMRQADRTMCAARHEARVLAESFPELKPHATQWVEEKVRQGVLTLDRCHRFDVERVLVNRQFCLYDDDAPDLPAGSRHVV